MARIATRLLMLCDALDKVAQDQTAMEAAGLEFKNLLETVSLDSLSCLWLRAKRLVSLTAKMQHVHFHDTLRLAFKALPCLFVPQMNVISK